MNTSRLPCPALLVRSILVLAALAVAGCSFSAPPQFRLNTEGRDPSQIGLSQADAISETLQRLFGTPDEPRVPEEMQLELGLLRPAAGPVGSDAQGNQRGLYRQHCVTCHGISGDGVGPAAAVLNPYPRDFREGVFKFTSTAGGAKPGREDLLRTLRQGIPDTAMPSFAVLPDEELAALVEYVKYLSIRGETELYLLQLVVDEDEYLPLSIHRVVSEGVLPPARFWSEAGELAVVPPERPTSGSAESIAASAAEGHRLYASRSSQCVKCHGPQGRGDGEQSELYDDWNKPKLGVTPEQTKKLARWFSLPIQRLRPRNFHREAFRGGDRPEDIYWRIHVGIKGTPMPAAGPAPGTPGALAPAEIWHVVDYIRALAD